MIKWRNFCQLIRLTESCFGSTMKLGSDSVKSPFDWQICNYFGLDATNSMMSLTHCVLFTAKSLFALPGVSEASHILKATLWI